MSTITRPDGLAAALTRLDLFADLGPDELAQVVAVVDEVVAVDDGAVVCAEGTPATHWWIVLEGEADVTINDVYVGSVGEGETIGELAALDDGVRSASVGARTPMQLATVSSRRFDELLDAAPTITKALLRQMSSRLRAASTAAAGSGPAPSPVHRHGAVRPGAAPTAAADFDPLDPTFFDDPHHAYAALRDAGAVHVDLIDSWIVGRYDDVARLMRDRGVSSDVAVATPTAFTEASAAFNAEIGDPQTMGRFDGPDHQRIRRLVTSAFTPRAMRRIRDEVEAIASDLLHESEDGEVDFVSAVALPLPSTVISRMLGVPSADEAMLHEWSVVAAEVPEPIVSPERQAEIKAAVQALRAYMLDLAETKRSHPTDDVLSGMVHAHFEEDRLSRMELVDNASLMYIAGHLTTVSLLTAMVALLWDNPDQLAMLREDPALVRNTVEETLRFESPLQFGRRFTTEAMELGGHAIPSGSAVITAIGSANRDPRHWGDDGHVFRVDRPGAHKHLTFAAGAHFCAGAALARMEAEIVLELLLTRYPHLVVASDERRWSHSFVLHGLETLPVRLMG